MSRQMRPLCKHARAGDTAAMIRKLALTIALIALPDAGAADCAVLLHGLARSKASMAQMGRALAGGGICGCE
ncbi:MAG: hypothetical protein U5N55_12945 [Cypionkella sp.]|nr:hypothetical protein [Cypionkella sp.]